MKVEVQVKPDGIRPWRQLGHTCAACVCAPSLAAALTYMVNANKSRLLFCKIAYQTPVGPHYILCSHHASFDALSMNTLMNDVKRLWQPIILTQQCRPSHQLNFITITGKKQQEQGTE